MKLLATSALALCLLVIVGCAEGNTPGPSADITDATNKVQASVEGMTCSRCSGEIESAVKGIDGVKACYADAKTGAVQVALADDADAEATKTEVEKVIAGLSDGKYKVKTIAVSTGEVNGEATSCPAGCTKPCCAEGTEATSCPAGCIKPCCADKAAGDAATSCPAGCTKPCCKKPEGDDVIEQIKTEVKDLVNDSSSVIPAIGE